MRADYREASREVLAFDLAEEAVASAQCGDLAPVSWPKIERAEELIGLG